MKSLIYQIHLIIISFESEQHYYQNFYKCIKIIVISYQNRNMIIQGFSIFLSFIILTFSSLIFRPNTESFCNLIVTISLVNSNQQIICLLLKIFSTQIWLYLQYFQLAHNSGDSLDQLLPINIKFQSLDNLRNPLLLNRTLYEIHSLGTYTKITEQLFSRFQIHPE